LQGILNVGPWSDIQIVNGKQVLIFDNLLDCSDIHWFIIFFHINIILILDWFIWSYSRVLIRWLSWLRVNTSSLNICLKIFLCWKSKAWLSWFVHFIWLLNIVISFIAVSESLNIIQLVFVLIANLSFQQVLDCIFLQDSWIISFALQKRSIHNALHFGTWFYFCILHILIFWFNLIIYLIIKHRKLPAMNIFTKIGISIIIQIIIIVWRG
jgi:hypothetical protein